MGLKWTIAKLFQIVNDVMETLVNQQEGTALEIGHIIAEAARVTGEMATRFVELGVKSIDKLQNLRDMQKRLRGTHR